MIGIKRLGLGSDETFDLIEKSKEAINQMVFFFSILWCSQSGNHPSKDLAKFGYKIDMKIKKFNYLSILFEYLYTWN
jgi:hypothetical protein